MFDPQDEIQLLALIEGELSDAEAEAVRARLAGDQRAAVMIERMIRDRAMLRADPEPLLPVNFMERIEPLLARPMLMDPVSEEAMVDVLSGTLPGAFPGARTAPAQPGEFRRMRRRQARRQRAIRWALVAGLGIAALGGVWSTINFGLPQSFSPSFWVKGPVVEETDSGETPAAHAHAADLSQRGDGVLHHLAPGIVFERFAYADTTAGKAGGSGEASAAPPREVQLVLVIQVIPGASDGSGAEQTMERVLAGLDERIALVQNFSYAEARELERQWLLARGTAEPSQPHRAEAGASGRPGAPRARRFDEMAERVRQQIREARRIEVERRPEVVGSRQLLGARELAASFAAQLDYSSRGATHTITIPAGRLDELLAALNAAPGQRTLLQPLPEVETAPLPEGRRAPRPPSPERLWLENMPRVQRMLAELAKDDPAGLIHLPVMVQPAP